MLALPDSRREEREEGRRGVVGRERGLRELEAERITLLLPAWGVLEAFMVIVMGRRLDLFCSVDELPRLLVLLACCASRVC